MSKPKKPNKKYLEAKKTLVKRGFKVLEKTKNGRLVAIKVSFKKC